MADTRTATRRSTSGDDNDTPKASTATAAPASRIEQRDRAGFLGNAAPIDSDATPAKTFAGSDVDKAYELSPETQGPHSREATGDV